MSIGINIALLAELCFAILLGLWALPSGFGGETAPGHLRTGFIGYASCAAVVAAALIWRPRPAAVAGMIFALIYSVPGTIALATSQLWEAAPTDDLARSMLIRFSLALASQLIALGALVLSRAWVPKSADVDLTTPAA